MKKKVETLVHLASMTEREVYARRHKLCEQKSALVEYRPRVRTVQLKSHILIVFVLYHVLMYIFLC